MIMAIAEQVPKSPLGLPQKRIDGPLKVSGTATYTSDHHFPGMLYAVPVTSTVANGQIKSIDVAAVEKMPGVRAVFHRQNIGKLFRVVRGKNFSGHVDEERPPLEDDVIRYYGQYVALVVADTFEQARAGANAVRVTYSHQLPNVDPNLTAEAKPEVQSERGDAAKAFGEASITIDQTYITPVETHNAIELHASVAVWDGRSFTLYETTQAVVNYQSVMTQILDVPKENLRVISKFLGSGFGGKLWPWTHSALAAAAARHLNKPVKLVLTRQMCFQTAGHRPRTQQRLRLSATPDGKLTSLQHDFVTDTSIVDVYKEDCGEATPFIYSVPACGRANFHARAGRGTWTIRVGIGDG
jgi:xanthine dehydrogenase YagR molybdenum-binding subunit